MYQIQQLERISFPLVNKFYKANVSRSKAKGSDQVWVVRESHQIIAAARLADISGHWFLTGVHVDADWQRQGIATLLVSQILSDLTDITLNPKQKACYTFPYIHLLSFYQSLGFIAIEENLLPKPLLGRFERYQKQGRKIGAMKK